MSEFYGLQNANGRGGSTPLAADEVVGFNSASDKVPGSVLEIGSGGTGGYGVYWVPNNTSSNLIITSVCVIVGGTMSATTSPKFLFWRRPNQVALHIVPGGTGDIAMANEAGTAYSLTVPKSAPTPIAGDVFVREFDDGGNVFAPGEAMMVELETAGDAATMAVIGHEGFFAKIAIRSFLTTGTAKTPTSAIGAIYRVAS